MPRVQEELLKFFEETEGSKKRELGHSLNTDEAAAMGAVFKAADLSAGFKVRLRKEPGLNEEKEGLYLMKCVSPSGEEVSDEGGGSVPRVGARHGGARRQPHDLSQDGPFPCQEGKKDRSQTGGLFSYPLI